MLAAAGRRECGICTKHIRFPCCFRVPGLGVHSCATSKGNLLIWRSWLLGRLCAFVVASTPARRAAGSSSSSTSLARSPPPRCCNRPRTKQADGEGCNTAMSWPCVFDPAGQLMGYLSPVLRGVCHHDAVAWPLLCLSRFFCLGVDHYTFFLAFVTVWGACYT